MLTSHPVAGYIILRVWGANGKWRGCRVPQRSPIFFRGPRSGKFRILGGFAPLTFFAGVVPLSGKAPLVARPITKRSRPPGSSGHVWENLYTCSKGPTPQKTAESFRHAKRRFRPTKSTAVVGSVSGAGAFCDVEFDFRGLAGAGPRPPPPKIFPKVTPRSNFQKFSKIQKIQKTFFPRP